MNREYRNKTCKDCDLTRSEENKDLFYKSELGYLGLSSRCKKCSAKQSIKWREQNYDRYREYQHQYFKDGYRDDRRIEWQLWAAKLKDLPCIDCGKKFHPVCMEWDHRDASVKKFDISYGVASTFKKERILNEIAKCDLVCAICHRMRSLARGTYSDFTSPWPASSADA